MPFPSGSPPWITNPGTIRWKVRPSKKPLSTRPANDAVVEVDQVGLRLVPADLAVHRVPSRRVVALLAAAPYKQHDERQEQEQALHATASSARRTSASAISTLYAVPASGVAPASASRESSTHGIGATPARTILRSPLVRAAATPTIGNDQRWRSIAFR